MIMQAYAVYDGKAGAYGQPFFAPTEGIATRMVLEALRDPNAMISKYPEDYTLYWIGAFDDSCGEFMAQKPLSVMNVKQLLGILVRNSMAVEAATTLEGGK